MPEFTSAWLKTLKTPSQCTDSTDSQDSTCLAVSAVSDTTQQKQPYQQPDASDNLSAFIAELPPVETWNLDETVARIRQLSHSERAMFFAALTHDWTAWKLAMAGSVRGNAERVSSDQVETDTADPTNAA
jgi:hypothetical protein